MLSTAATSSSSQRRWTVLSLLEWSTNHLIEHGFDEARLHVELLLSHVLYCSRLHLYTNFDRPLSIAELSRFRELFQRRIAHEPLQYIVGETECMGFPLYVNPSVLIPRPETEQLIEHALKAISSLNKKNVAVLDIGTGSGNIAIAIAMLSPNTSVISIDASHEALVVAKLNAERNAAANVSFAHASVFDDFLSGQMFDVIVSNPPYISRDEFTSIQPEVRDYEPRVATTDDADGFRFIRRISELACMRLRGGGFLFVEIAYNQADEAVRIVEGAGLLDVHVLHDFAGHPRIVTARR